MIQGNCKAESRNVSLFFLFRVPCIWFYKIKSLQVFQISTASELDLRGFSNVPKPH